MINADLPQNNPFAFKKPLKFFPLKVLPFRVAFLSTFIANNVPASFPRIFFTRNTFPNDPWISRITNYTKTRAPDINQFQNSKTAKNCSVFVQEKNNFSCEKKKKELIGFKITSLSTRKQKYKVRNPNWPVPEPSGAQTVKCQPFHPPSQHHWFQFQSSLTRRHPRSKDRAENGKQMKNA